MERAVSIVPKTFFFCGPFFFIGNGQNKRKPTERISSLSLPPVGRRRRNTIFTVQDLKIELTKNVFSSRKERMSYNPLFYIVVHLLNEAEEFEKKGCFFYDSAAEKPVLLYIHAPKGHRLPLSLHSLYVYTSQVSRPSSGLSRSDITQCLGEPYVIITHKVAFLPYTRL